MLDYYEIGQQIRKVRKAHGMSQEELAAQIGISTTHMSHIETGNTKLSLQVLVDISNALDVRTDDLLCRNTAETATAITEDIAAVLNRCSVNQLKIIADIVKSAKNSMDKYQ